MKLLQCLETELEHVAVRVDHRSVVLIVTQIFACCFIFKTDKNLGLLLYISKNSRS